MQEKLVQIAFRNDGHLQHGKAGTQCFIQFTRTGIAIVHGCDETGGWLYGNPFITRQIYDMAEIQNGV